MFSENTRDFSVDELKQHICSLGPIVEKLLLTSNPLRRTYEQLRLSVYLKVPGCWLAASHGRGKTIALEYCARRLKTEIPGLPVFIVNEQILPGNELRSFFIRALTASNYDKPVSSDSTALRHRLPMYWSELSKYSPLGSVVLFLDECQSMRQSDISLIKDISNQIVRLGGSLQTIAFGESPSFESLVSKWTAPQNENGAIDRLVGGRRIALSKYDQLSDWTSLFKELDSTTFDELGGMSIVQSYFSHLNIRDFEFSNEAPVFFKALRNQFGRDASVDLNLRRIFVGIRYALMTTSLNTVNSHVTTIASLPENTWADALKFSSHS